MSELKRPFLIEVVPLSVQYVANIMLNVCTKGSTDVVFDNAALVDAKPEHESLASFVADYWLLDPEVTSANVSTITGFIMPKQLIVDHFGHKKLQHRALVTDIQGKTTQANPQEFSMCIYGRSLDESPESYESNLLVLNAINGIKAGKIRSVAGIYKLSQLEGEIN